MSVDVPVTVTDNAVSVIGDSTVVNTAAAPATTTTTAPSDGPVTTGEDGILSGNQVLASVTAPVTVSGQRRLRHRRQHGREHRRQPRHHHRQRRRHLRSHRPRREKNGILSGNQIIPVINAPVNVTGNAVSGIGDSTVIGGSHGTTTGNGGGTWVAPTTSGENGILSGNQIIPVINAPDHHRRQRRLGDR